MHSLTFYLCIVIFFWRLTVEKQTVTIAVYHYYLCADKKNYSINFDIAEETSIGIKYGI